MLFKTRVMSLAGVLLIMGCGLSAPYASCITSICQAKGPRFDCHAVPDTPDWICKEPERPKESEKPVTTVVQPESHPTQPPVAKSTQNLSPAVTVAPAISVPPAITVAPAVSVPPAVTVPPAITIPLAATVPPAVEVPPAPLAPFAIPELTP